MRSNETNDVGQAVFGYSNGHRLLTSTLSLSSVDIYELAAGSDLAPGAQISGSSSYLTGFSLPESKLFALIRTWLAPEMPRPGCVWSHVLLLDQTLLATQIDLTVLQDLHRRPDGYASELGFSKAITINRRLRGSRADIRVTEKVLSACYDDLPLDPNQTEPQTVEQAIFAVWSQQWPRLRRQFVFRSIATTSDLKGQFLRVKHGTATARDVKMPSWLEDAAVDATSQTVTPLRRFLWRYGKDIQSDRETLPELVRLYSATRSGKRSYKTAGEVLARFPLGQADTLKKDLLGLSSDKLSQVPSVSAVEFMHLLVKHQDLGVDHDAEELASIFSKVDVSHLVELTSALMASRDQLGDKFSSIFEAILPILDDRTVGAPQTPTEFSLMAVARRAELLTPVVIDKLSTDELLNVWLLDLKPEQRTEIVRALIQRPYIESVAEHALNQPEQTLREAMYLSGRSQLDDSWFSFFRNNVSAFVDQIATFTTDGDLMIAANLFAFPMEPEAIVRPWFTAFKVCRSSLSHDDEARFLVYLLALSVKYGIENNRDVLLAILDRLRYRILRSELPSDAESKLSKCLPSDDARWDLNKRLLKLFRKAYRRGQEFDEVLDTLNLTDDEYAYATDQDPENMVRRFWRAFNPWTYWS